MDVKWEHPNRFSGVKYITYSKFILKFKIECKQCFVGVLAGSEGYGALQQKAFLPPASLNAWELLSLAH